MKLPERGVARSGYGNVWFTLVCVAESFDSALVWLSRHLFRRVAAGLVPAVTGKWPFCEGRMRTGSVGAGCFAPQQSWALQGLCCQRAWSGRCVKCEHWKALLTGREVGEGPSWGEAECARLGLLRGDLARAAAPAIALANHQFQVSEGGLVRSFLGSGFWDAELMQGSLI